MLKLTVHHPRVKDHYGPWKVNRRNLTLDLPHYYVDLTRMDTSAQCLDWIFQVAGKTWATPELIGELVKAIDDIIKPQATLCGGGFECGRKGLSERASKRCLNWTSDTL